MPGRELCINYGFGCPELQSNTRTIVFAQQRLMLLSFFVVTHNRPT